YPRPGCMGVNESSVMTISRGGAGRDGLGVGATTGPRLPRIESRDAVVSRIARLTWGAAPGCCAPGWAAPGWDGRAPVAGARVDVESADRRLAPAIRSAAESEPTSRKRSARISHSGLIGLSKLATTVNVS